MFNTPSNKIYDNWCQIYMTEGIKSWSERVVLHYQYGITCKFCRLVFDYKMRCFLCHKLLLSFHCWTWFFHCLWSSNYSNYSTQHLVLVRCHSRTVILCFLYHVGRGVWRRSVVWHNNFWESEHHDLDIIDKTGHHLKCVLHYNQPPSTFWLFLSFPL